MNAILKKVKQAIRHPYAWPGGYPVFTILSDGAMLCACCARENFKQIARSTINHARDDWAALGAEVFWEGATEFCAQCNTELESAYGDPDAPEST